MSRLIAQLEDDVGFVLVNRSDGHIRLTAKGDQFWEEAKRVLAAVRSMTACADRLSGRIEASIRIVTLPGLIDLFVATPLAAFCAKYPEAKISLEVMNRTELESALASGTCDLGLTVLPVKAPSEYEVDVLTSLKAQCVFPRDHVLDKLRVVHASDLLEFPYLSLREGSALRRRVDDTFDALGLKRNMRIECQSQDVVFEMVAAGMGVSVVLPNGVRPSRYGLGVRPFMPEISMEYAMLRRPRNRTNRRLGELTSFIVSEVERIAESSETAPLKPPAARAVASGRSR